MTYDGTIMKSNQIVAISLLVEDFSRAGIFVGGDTYPPDKPLSTVGLQFMIICKLSVKNIRKK